MRESVWGSPDVGRAPGCVRTQATLPGSIWKGGIWRGVATQVRTHRTHGTQEMRRFRQDATPTDQTQGPFLLMCPICSLNHTRASHRCSNPTCPGSGNLKATPGCCSASPPRCVNCGGPHTATYRECESCPSPPTLTRSAAAETIVLPPPTGDEMDMATDDDDLSLPASPTRSLQSAFEMATPRARSTTILPAPVGPSQGHRPLPPTEPVSPSPMSRNPSGLAR